MSKDRYRLVRPLGTGNFTVGVYLAEHIDLGREVAVKLLELDRVNERDALLEEARNMAALDQHDNVVQVFDAGDWDSDHVYIASEACLGGSLEGLCTAGGPGLDPATACRLISDACRGLDYMHRHGLLHLDVRPANILLKDDTPKLGDFGLARWVGNSAVPEVYTPHAAPEMLRDYDGTPASDQYAMAMTLGHLLSGGSVCVLPPAPDDHAAWREFPPLDSCLALNVPDRLRRVMHRATQYDSAARYSDVEAFKRAVDGATPATSFALMSDASLTSIDGVWSMELGVSRSGWSVTVRRNGRRDSRLGLTGATERAALKHARTFVTNLAYP